MQKALDYLGSELTSSRSSHQHLHHHRCKCSVRSQSDLPACPLKPSAGHVSRTNQTQRTTAVSWWIELSVGLLFDRSTCARWVCAMLSVLHWRCGVQFGCDLAACGRDWRYEDPLQGSWRQADPGRLRSLTPVPEPGEKQKNDEGMVGWQKETDSDG